MKELSSSGLEDCSMVEPKDQASILTGPAGCWLEVIKFYIKQSYGPIKCVKPLI